MDQVMARVQGLIKKFRASAMSQAESSPSVVPRHGLFQEHGFEAGRESQRLLGFIGLFHQWHNANGENRISSPVEAWP